MLRIAMLTLAAATLAACATPTMPRDDDLDTMAAECRERGGILTPIQGEKSGNERANFRCDIPGGASRVR